MHFLREPARSHIRPVDGKKGCFCHNPTHHPQSPVDVTLQQDASLLAEPTHRLPGCFLHQRVPALFTTTPEVKPIRI